MRYSILVLLLFLVGCDEEFTDFCKGISCGEGYCVAQGKTPLCICHFGYVNNVIGGVPRCIEDVTDPCSGVSCSDHGVCAVMATRPICLCDTGYYHDTSEPDNPKCLSPESLYCSGIDCGGNGHCYVIGTTPYCACDEGYKSEGISCMPLTCDGVLCSGRGRCVKDITTIGCDCDAGYESVGLSCLDINRDRCVTVLCDEWRSCDPMVGLCEVKEGRCGDDRDCNLQKPYCDPEQHICLEGDPDPCHPSPCEDLHRQRCVTVGGDEYLCLCDSGFIQNQYDECVYNCSFLPFSEANSDNSGCNCFPGYQFENSHCSLVCDEHQYAAPDQSRCLCDLFYSGVGCSPTENMALVFGGAQNDRIRAVVHSGTDLIIGGSFESSGNFNPHQGFNDLYSSNGEGDLFFTQLRGDGYYRSTTALGWSGREEIYHMAVDSSKNLYIMGIFEETINIDPLGYHELISAGGEDIFIIKYSAEGRLLWGERIGGPGDDLPGGLIVADQVVITGAFDGEVTLGMGDTVRSNGDYDGFLGVMTLDGEPLWLHTIGGFGRDQGIDIAVSEKQVVLLGSYQNSVDFDPSSQEDFLTGNGTFITRFDRSGGYLGTSTINYTTPKKVALDENKIFIGGLFKGSIDFDPTSIIESHKAKGGADIFISTFDLNGVYLETESFGSVANDTVQDLFLYDNKLYIGGYCGDNCSMGSDILLNQESGYIMTFIDDVFLLSKTFPVEIQMDSFSIDHDTIWIGGFFEETIDQIISRKQDAILYGIRL